MNKMIVLVLVLMTLPSVTADCDIDYSNLENFYKASEEENYDKYIALMDTDYIYENLADEESYENYVKAAWEVYDTKEYSIELHKCNDIGTGSVIFFNLEAEIEAEENIELERDYVAVFEKGKLQFVTDMEIFSYHQSQAYMLQYLNVTKPIIDEELRDAEAIIDYYENNPVKKKSYSFIWWIILFVVFVLLIYYNKGVFKKFAKKYTKISKEDIDKIKKHGKNISDHTKKASMHLKKAAEKLSEEAKKHKHYIHNTKKK